jgi:hypothetical protein
MDYVTWSKTRLAAAEALRAATLAVRRDYAMPGTELMPSRFTVCTRMRDPNDSNFSTAGLISVFVANREMSEPTHKKVNDFLRYELEFLAYIQEIVEEWECSKRPELPSEREAIEQFKSHWWNGPLKPGTRWVKGDDVDLSREHAAVTTPGGERMLRTLPQDAEDIE